MGSAAHLAVLSFAESLDHMSEDPKSHKNLMATGCLPPLVAMLKSAPHATKSSASALLNIARGGPETHGPMMELGVVPTLVNMVQHPPSKEHAQVAPGYPFPYPQQPSAQRSIVSTAAKNGTRPLQTF